MTISVTQAQKIISELRDYEISLGRDPKTWYTYKNHVYGTAEIAKKIARKIKTMNPNRLYVMGLLHDICRIEEDRIKRFHGILGYEKFITIDKDVARACLLHSFLCDELPPYNDCAEMFFQQKKDYQFVADFLQKNPPEEEDYLIQLSDNLANKNGFVTIEERIAEYIERHGSLDIEDNAVKAKKLKRYFDKKIGCDIYSLFNE